MSKKKDLLRTELRQIMTGIVGRQSNRAVNRIVRLVGDTPPDDRFAVMGRMVAIIQEEYLDSGRPRHARETFNQLAAALGDQALTWAQIRYLTEYFALVESPGETENFGAKSVLCIGFYRYVGSSLELSIRFCRLLFSYAATQLESYDRLAMRGKADNQREYDPRTHPLPLLSLYAAAVGCHEDAPQKLWLVRLVEAAGEGNREAEEYLLGVIEQLEMYAIILNQQLPILSQEELDASSPKNPLERLQFQFVVYPHTPRLVLPADLKPVIVKLQRKCSGRTERDLAQASRFSQWFSDSREQLAARFEACSRELEDKPRYGLRPYGYDSAVVKVSVLNVVGICSFVFHCEGERFPDVKLEISVKKSGVGLCTLWAYFRDAELQCTDHLLENWQDYDVDFLRSVFEYVIMDALHRIVCREPVRNEAGEDVNRSVYRGERTEKKHVVVRPFLRRLPLGYRASDNARKLAFTEMGWLLPDGVTFVQLHDRWASLPAGKPAPLFTYTDESIMQSVAR